MRACSRDRDLDFFMFLVYLKVIQFLSGRQLGKLGNSCSFGLRYVFFFFFFFFFFAVVVNLVFLISIFGVGRSFLYR